MKVGDSKKLSFFIIILTFQDNSLELLGYIDENVN